MKNKSSLSAPAQRQETPTTAIASVPGRSIHRTIKKLAGVILVCLCFVVQARGQEYIEDDNDVVQEAAMISLSPDSFHFEPNEALTDTIIIAANVDWTVRETSDGWLALERTSGDGNDTIIVTADPNTDSEQRSALIILSTGDKPESIHDTIKVAQDAPYIVLSSERLSADSLVFDPNWLKADTVTINVAANVIDWRVSAEDAEWLTIDPDSGYRDASFTVTAEPNPGAERTADIIVAGGGTTDTIHVVQREPYITLSAERLSADTLYFDPNRLYIDTVTINVEANVVGWEIEAEDAEWLTIDPEGGDKDSCFTVTAKPNTGRERTADIIVAGGGATDAIHVVQKAALISLSPGSLHFEPDEALTDTIIIAANVDRTVRETSDGWLTLDNESANDTIFVTAEPNTDSQQRSALIIFSTGDEPESIHDTVVVVQDAPYIILSADTLYFDPNRLKIDAVTINVAANVIDWRVSAEDAEWLTIDPNSGYRDASFTVTAAPNTGKERTADIIVAGGGATDAIHVVQEAALISLSADNLHFGPVDHLADTVIVTSNVPLTVLKTAWLRIDSIQGSDSLIITAEPNLSNAVLNGWIILACGSDDESVADTIHIVQDCPVVSALPEGSTAKTMLLEAGLRLSKTINVASNVTWTVLTNVTWITFDHDFGIKNGTFTATAGANPTVNQREASIIVKGTGQSADTIRVVQKGPEISSKPESLLFLANEALEQTVEVTTNVDAWTVRANADCDWLTFIPTFGTASGHFQVTAEPNRTNRMRTAEIIISGSTKSITIPVSQAPPVSASPASIAFEAENDLEKIVSVVATGEWLASADVDWVSFNTTSGNGDGTFTIVAEANDKGLRQGEITIASGGNKAIIPISQDAYVAVRLTASPGHISFEANSPGAQIVNVAANVAWAVSVNVPWLTVTPSSGSGDGTFIATATTNIEEERQGIISVTGAGKSFFITVTQKETQEIKFTIGDVHLYAPDRRGTDAIVVSNGEEGGYSGDVVIPPVAPYLSRIYRVTKIGENAFFKCDKLTSVSLPNSVVDIGDRAFGYCSRLTSIEFPNSVERIGEWAFSSCTNLASVKLSNSIRKIMNGAFYGCEKLTSVVIPDNVAEIACLSFYACQNLASIEVEWTTPPNLIKVNPDFSDYSRCTLIVPKGTRMSYISVWHWAHFSKIIERGGVAADKVSESLSIRAASGRLYVDSPSAETVYVYSFTGKLLLALPKAPGQTTFDIPTHQNLLIIRGSSGWIRKLVVND
jgi:hypothetical protein